MSVKFHFYFGLWKLSAKDLLSILLNLSSYLYQTGPGLAMESNGLVTETINNGQVKAWTKYLGIVKKKGSSV